MAKKNKTIWIAQLDRFGYNLTAAGETEEGARLVVLREYIKAYIECNGIDPAEDPSDRSYAEEGQTALDVAKEDIITWNLEVGRCEWM